MRMRTPSPSRTVWVEKKSLPPTLSDGLCRPRGFQLVRPQGMEQIRSGEVRGDWRSRVLFLFLGISVLCMF